MERPTKTDGRVQPSRCNVTALRKASRRLSQYYDAVLAPHGLRATQRAILVNVATAGAPTMQELASALVLDRTALNHNLKPLERDGLLRILVDERDRRGRRIELTDHGRTVLEQSREDWERAQIQFETLFGGQRAAELRAALDAIAALNILGG